MFRFFSFPRFAFFPFPRFAFDAFPSFAFDAFARFAFDVFPAFAFDAFAGFAFARFAFDAFPAFAFDAFAGFAFARFAFDAFAGFMFGPFPGFPRGPFPRFAFGSFDGFAFGSSPGFSFCAFGGFPFIRFDGCLPDRCSRLRAGELSGGVSRGFCRGVGLCFRGLARVCDRYSVRPAPPAARPDPIAGGPPGMRAGFVGRACDDAFDWGGSRDLDPEEITVVGARSRPEERFADSCEPRRDVWADSRSRANSRSEAAKTMRARRGTRAVPGDARARRRRHAALRHGRCGSGANRDNERCRDVG